MNALIVNPPVPECGVHNYGRNFYECLRASARHSYAICEPWNTSDLHVSENALKPDVFIFNYHPGIAQSAWYATYARERKSVAIYHDGELPRIEWRAILFSDPTMRSGADRWKPIGRPLPPWAFSEYVPHDGPVIIGVNGFRGAWADQAVGMVIKEFDTAIVRLHLPFSAHCDPQGHEARLAVQRCSILCKSKPRVNLEVCHDFLPMDELLKRLSANDLNLYVRDLPPGWRGVSSVLDVALAVHRPIAVNLCSGFRHVHSLQPSICVEYNSLRTILNNGTRPLEELYSAWAPSKIAAQVDDVIDLVL